MRAPLTDDLRRIREAVESPAGRAAAKRVEHALEARKRRIFARSEVAMQREYARHQAALENIRKRELAELEEARRTARQSEDAWFRSKGL